MENNSKYYTIGLMSGTSLDGVDLAYCEFTFLDEKWSYSILESKMIEYSQEWKSKLKNAIHISKKKLVNLDIELGHYFGEKINKFIEEKKIEKIDFISSHGHTIFHQPERKYTLQIGCGKTINKITKVKIVFDFRSKDVSLGGQGAPLVPIGDKLLFSEFDFCINIGGISNISFQKNKERKAFDICFSNMILNELANKIGLNYDSEGQIAKSNKVNQKIVEKLLNLDFKNQSLGVEIYRKNIMPILANSNEKTENLIATVTEYIAIKIANCLTENADVLITGGGAFNTYLMELIKKKSKANIEVSSKELIDFKEALIFGFLGVLRIENIPNCIASVTGAEFDCVGGKISDFY